MSNLLPNQKVGVLNALTTIIVLIASLSTTYVFMLLYGLKDAYASSDVMRIFIVLFGAAWMFANILVALALIKLFKSSYFPKQKETD